MSYARAMGDEPPRGVIPPQQECTAAPGTPLRRACEDYNAGVGLFEQGRFAEALAKFTAAFAIDPDNVVRVSLGVATFKLGRFEEAVRHWRRYLEGERNRERRRVVRGYIDNALRLLNPATQTFQQETAKADEEARTEGPPVSAPLVPAENPYARRTTIGIWVATGVGVFGLVGLGYWVTRRR